jgi:hypothetical protein
VTTQLFTAARIAAVLLTSSAIVVVFRPGAEQGILRAVNAVSGRSELGRLCRVGTFDPVSASQGSLIMGVVGGARRDDCASSAVYESRLGAAA